MIIDAVLSLGDPCCGLLTLGFVIGGCLWGSSESQQQQKKVRKNTVSSAPQPAATRAVYVYGQQTGGQFPMGQYPISSMPGPGQQMMGQYPMGQYPMGQYPMMGQQVMYLWERA
jgi:hypothetical protein